ncbi:MAG: transposase [Bacteroidota bacterium]
MGFAYSIKNQHKQHFVTFTVHQWVDILIESLQFCQKEKGLKIYAWVIMSNHIHLIIQSDVINLSDIIRDFKKYTASQIIKSIENNTQESRKKWLLWLLKKENNICFWEEGYHGEEIFTKEFYDIKRDYIHLNPVRAGIVEKEEDYIFSSAGDYYGIRKGLLDIEFE